MTGRLLTIGALFVFGVQGQEQQWKLYPRLTPEQMVKLRKGLTGTAPGIPQALLPEGLKADPEPVGRCSIRLIEIVPPQKNGTMTILPPASDDKMPRVKAPAPPCPKTTADQKPVIKTQ